MKNWNVIVTTLPGVERERALLKELKRLGEFHPTQFKDVCLGRVPDTAQFLEVVRQAGEDQAPWVVNLARVIPVAKTFHFTPETFAAQLKEAVAPYLEEIAGGTFYVRVERRGLAGKIMSQAVEREVADHLFALAESQGKQPHASFQDPDFIVAAETIGDECGVALLSRELRQRYHFVQTR